MYKNYKDLQVWQKAMDLVEAVYNITKNMPTEEKFGLMAQLRRAAVSIPSNIAEGYTCFSTKEYLNFLSIARGSTSEVETQLLICDRLHYFEANQIDNILDLTNEVSRRLTSIITKLNDQIN